MLIEERILGTFQRRSRSAYQDRPLQEQLALRSFYNTLQNSQKNIVICIKVCIFESVPRPASIRGLFQIKPTDGLINIPHRFPVSSHRLSQVHELITNLVNSSQRITQLVNSILTSKPYLLLKFIFQALCCN